MRSPSRSLFAFTALLLLTLAALPQGASAQSFAVLQDFNYTNGRRPLTPPILASDGNLYGATLKGGAHPSGVIYKLTPQGELTAFYTFCSHPSCVDGSSPEFGPTQGKDGNLYGTTSTGGANNLGMVYKLTLSGELTVLHSFCLCAEGWYPNSLVEDGKGGFYGSTLEAGSHQYGTIFHLTGQGQLTTLYNFCDSQPGCISAYSNDGEPQPLILGADGNIYGVTDTGGHSYFLCSVGGCGTVFEITPQGEFSIIYNFCSLAHCADGAQPLWLVQGVDGNFYGTTSLGGSGITGGGTVFQLTASGVLSTLHSFSTAMGNSGYAPYDLIQGTNGVLYGITSFGGNEAEQCQNLGCGSVFSVTTSGAFESLHDFDVTDGYVPAGIVQTSDTTLTGTTSYGGAHKDGVIFSLNFN
ncbi:MAG: choice-of-anchor tandem repeat GloVer-containing protein [Candidatus Sulfotelmatobacter sp.]